MMRMTNLRLPQLFFNFQSPRPDSPFWIFLHVSASLRCGARNWTQDSMGDLTSQKTVRMSLIWTWNFYLHRPSVWPRCSLCVTVAAEIQVLSAGAGLQPRLCLLRSDSNCSLQRWLFMGTPFLCLTEAQCSSSKRGSDASVSHTHLLVFFSRVLGHLLHISTSFPFAQLALSPCLIHSSTRRCLNIMLLSAFHVSTLVLCCLLKELSPLLVSGNSLINTMIVFWHLYCLENFWIAYFLWTFWEKSAMPMLVFFCKLFFLLTMNDQE